MQKLQQNQNGITLIALIITIIVMLILVGVTINVALNGGLFTKADDARKQTQLATEKEILQNTALGFLEDDGEISFAKFETEYTGKAVEGYTIKSEGEYVTATKGEKIFYITKYGGISEEKPTEKEYTFTLNQLKEGGYKMEDDSRIAFNKDYVLGNVIKEDLSANEKYTIDNDGDVMFAIESTDGIFSSYMHMLHYLQSGEGLPETVQYITLCETYNANGEFWFGVWKRGENGYPEEVMDGSTTKEEQEAVMEEFLETYGDVEFRFLDVSSLEIE